MSGPDCKEPGRVAPLIDRNRCEGKADCVRVCPYDVFEMGTLDGEDRRGLSFLGKLKAFAKRQTWHTACNTSCIALPQSRHHESIRSHKTREQGPPKVEKRHPAEGARAFQSPHLGAFSQ